VKFHKLDCILALVQGLKKAGSILVNMTKFMGAYSRYPDFRRVDVGSPDQFL
jgi:hypothetical protein